MRKFISIALALLLLIFIPIFTYAEEEGEKYDYAEDEGDYYYSISITNETIQDGLPYVLLVLEAGTSISNITEESIQCLEQAVAKENTVSFNTFSPKTYGEHDVYIAGSGFSEPVKTGTLGIPPGIISGTVAITGTAETGKTITVDTSGIISDEPGMLTYQWYRDGVLIESAVSDSYVLTSEDENKVLKVIVYAQNYNGSLKAEILANAAKPESHESGGGGGGGGSAARELEVTLDKIENGTISVLNTSPEKGDKVSFIVTPDSGYDIANVIVKDKKGKEIEFTQDGNVYYFVMPSRNVTISAEFEKKTVTISFIDVNETDWFFDSVVYSFSNGIMNGITEYEFAPDKETTRGMLVTMLYRLEKEPEVTAANNFNDVTENSYYRDAVVWATTNGIVTGYDENTFGAEDNITREQISTILFRYAEYKKADTKKGVLENLNEFVDVGDISSWAFNPLKWACGNQLMNGMGDNTLDPKGAATRAQVATLLMRFIENISEN